MDFALCDLQIRDWREGSLDGGANDVGCGGRKLIGGFRFCQSAMGIYHRQEVNYMNQASSIKSTLYELWVSLQSSTQRQAHPTSQPPHSSHFLRFYPCWSQALSNLIELLHTRLIAPLFYPLLSTHGIGTEEVIHHPIEIRPSGQSRYLTRSCR